MPHLACAQNVLILICGRCACVCGGIPKAPACYPGRLAFLLGKCDLQASHGNHLDRDKTDLAACSKPDKSAPLHCCWLTSVDALKLKESVSCLQKEERCQQDMHQRRSWALHTCTMILCRSAPSALTFSRTWSANCFACCRTSSWSVCHLQRGCGVAQLGFAY